MIILNSMTLRHYSRSSGDVLASNSYIYSLEDQLLIILVLTQMLDLGFINTPTTLHTTYETTALYGWLHLGSCSVQPPTKTAVRIEASGNILMEVLFLLARKGHFSSHLDFTKED